MPDYEAIRRLGNGAFGEVWLVHDRALDEKRAVKFVHANKISNPSNFYEEPHTLKSLKHDNIVEVHDAGRLPDGRLYIAMAYHVSGSIEDMRKGEVVPLRSAIRYICDVCRAVEYAHSRGYVHRDIKPANILVSETGRAKLSDFGLATKMTLFGAASPVGYLSHIAPEVITDGEFTKLSDVYAIGVTLYRLINGDDSLPSYDETDIEHAIIEGRFPDRKVYLPFVPRNLRSLTNKAISVLPRQRHTSARMLRKALESIDIKVDWEQEALPNGTKYVGIGTNREFTAELNNLGKGIHSFCMMRNAPGKPKRVQHADCIKSGLLGDIERHASVVLSRITLSGR